MSLAESFPAEESIKAEAVNGYLNFRIDSTALANDVLHEVFEKGEKYGSPENGEGKTVVLDYSSPNVAKPFHIGHLGTTVIGHSLKKLHEFAGYKCIGINHLGDWGTQFGKLIVAYRLWGSKEEIENGGIDKLVELYVKFHAEAENNPALNDDARAEFTKLEHNDPDNIELWKWFIKISLEEYEKTYAQLGIEFDSYNGESFYTDKMPAQVEKLRQSGIMKIDDGASIVDLSEYNMPPCLILKRDGSTLYPTRDIAAAVYRKNEYNFDKCIYVTSAGQSLHFAQWFKVVEMMGYEWADKLVHVPYGTVSINGAKLATRTGNVILLKDLFAQAIEKVYQITGEKNPDMSEEKKNEIAEKVGVGAIVFYYLSNNRIKDINFMLEDALSYDGNTGPYVQYTYARTCSVLAKASDINTDCAYKATTAEEHDLLRVISIFPERVEAAIESYEPFYITRYILDLAAAFNRFYHNCSILTESDPDIVATRVALAKATKTILGTAFELICMKKTEQI
jgi:arginyl-tRNA synthetase